MQTYVIIALCLIIATQQILHHIERKDLYNRIMAKDLSQYQRSSIKCRTIDSILWKNHDGRRGK